MSEMISGSAQTLSESMLALAPSPMERAGLRWKAKAYFELLKPRLSFLVAFSCAFGYGLATKGNVNWTVLFMLTFGGFLLSGASVCINQIIERDLDKIMTRTMGRPIPTGRVCSSLLLSFPFLRIRLPLFSRWCRWCYTVLFIHH